jgi:hypothetical protein
MMPPTADILSNARPSTQVGYGESQEITEKQGISEPADHQLDQTSGKGNELQAVIELWDTLPEAARQAILAMIQSGADPNRTATE